MEKIFFKEFMQHDVVQKTVIFADAFNLNIDSWRPSNTSKHPYQINFYNKGMLVGYISIKTFEIGSSKYPETDMPFTLFTPLGKIEGHYNSHFQEFVYDIQNRKDAFAKIDGLFKVKDYNLDPTKDYFIASTLDLTNLKGESIRIVFNRLGGNYEVEINKRATNTEETTRLYICSAYIRIEHLLLMSPNQKITFANVKIDLEKSSEVAPTHFDFLDKESYDQTLDIKNEMHRFFPIWYYLDQIDFSSISAEIEKNDPRILEFIEEVRNELTLLANGITPVCIYDKIARICFFKEKDKFKLDFTRAQNVEVALTRNRILRKMPNNKH